MMTCPHGAFVTSMRGTWLGMQQADVINGSFVAEEHSLLEVMIFLARLNNFRTRKRQRRLSDQCLTFLESFVSPLLACLAAIVEHYTIHEYSHLHDVNKPPPSLVAKHGTRKYVRVHPESVWRMVEATDSINVTLGQVLQVRQQDADAGAHRTRNLAWEKLHGNLYSVLLRRAWGFANHLCISTDGSSHSYHEVLVAIAYSHELQQSCYPRLQFILPGKDVHESELVLTHGISVLAAENRCERVAAYRQLQAISHMCEQLQGRGLNDYDVAVNTRAIAANEVRAVVDRDGARSAYLVDKDKRTMLPVLPETVDYNSVPLLVVLLDQGSIGAAASGFLDHLEKMIVLKWEKIHRLINDIKGPLRRCCSGAPLKAQVYSSYLWQFHKKPFGSGTFGTQLQRALNLFPLRNNVGSPLFQKYVHRLAAEWDMPCTTQTEQQIIFDKLCDLESLRHRNAQCKLGRWFSWNQAAQEKLADFTAWKLILEDYVELSGDPDDDQVKFDELNKAAAQKTPLDTLDKMRQQGGFDTSLCYFEV